MLKVILGSLLFLPLFAAAGVIVLPGVPDAVFDGDGALIELATRAALAGEQLTGPYSRGGFNHPGPLYFYLLVPLYWLTHGSALSLHVTAALINLASLAGMFWVLWRCTNKWAAVWFVLLCAFYLTYLGPAILLSIWNPHVTVLPFLFSVTCFAAVATGRSIYWPIAIFTSSFVVQSHVGYALAIVLIGAFTFGLFLLPNIRNAFGINALTSGNVWPTFVTGFALGVLLWMPPIIEQFSTSPGNLANILRFFADNSGDRSWSEVYSTASGIFSDYGLMLFYQAHSKLFLSQPNPSWLRSVIGWGQGLALLAAYGVARYRRQEYAAALSLSGIVLYGAMLLSLKRIVGPILDYLVIWMTSLSVVVWMVIGWVCLQPLASKVRSRIGRPAEWVVTGLTLATLLYATSVNVHAFLREARSIVANRAKNTATRDMDHILTQSLNFLRQNGVQECLLRAFDFETWPAVAGLTMGLSKAGVSASVDPQWPAKYPARYASASIPFGMLLVCRPAIRPRLQPFAALTLVVETENCTVFWQSLTKEVEGEFSFEMLPVFAFSYRGFSKTGYIQDTAFRWSSDGESVLSVRLEPDRTYRLSLTASIPQNVKAMAVSFNDHPIAEFAYPQAWQWQEFSAQLPGEYVRTLNTVSFHYLYREPPETPRLEGRDGSLVAFRSIAFVKMSNDTHSSPEP